MRLLVLGGTHFLGRHVVDAALARDHAVTVFTRGRRLLPWSQRVTALVGDRDPRNAPGLAALETGAWDSVVDTSGYVPRVVRASAELLASRVGRYLFVSSISVFAKVDRAGLDEGAQLATLDNPQTEEIAKNYGALKAACEVEVAKVFGARATQVRPGLIVGPFDGTDRFGYWPARFIHPQLLGERGAHAVVPAPRDRPMQLIDARDLASWMVDLVELEVGGIFNATSPAGQWTMGDLIDACVAQATAPPEPVWVAGAKLADFHVEPWMGLPLWIPDSDPDSAGFMQLNCEKARAGGLATRPLADTVRDTAEWLVQRDNSKAWQNVLTAARERQIVSAGSGAG